MQMAIKNAHEKQDKSISNLFHSFFQNIHVYNDSDNFPEVLHRKPRSYMDFSRILQFGQN